MTGIQLPIDATYEGNAVQVTDRETHFEDDMVFVEGENVSDGWAFEEEVEFDE